MKTKTLNLLNLIKSKKEEIRKEKRDKAIHEYAQKHHKPLTKEEEREFQQMIREGNRLLAIDKRADDAANKAATKIRLQMFGY